MRFADLAADARSRPIVEIAAQAHPESMTELTPLEHTALNAILDELGEGRASIEAQILQASVLTRDNTGGGFFTKLLLHGDIPESFGSKHLGMNVWIAIEGMGLGLGMILHLREGEAPVLEGYAVGHENTSVIDFARARFALVDEPGSLPAMLSLRHGATNG